MVTSHLWSASRYILGPLLFVIFINDLPDVVQNGTETALYADDTKLYNTITSTDDCKCLQQSLTNLNCWSVQNNIRLVLTITRKKTPVTYDYKLGTESLTRVDSERILESSLPSDFHGNFKSIVSSPRLTKC